MRNHFLLRSLCTATIFFSSLYGFAQGGPTDPSYIDYSKAPATTVTPDFLGSSIGGTIPTDVSFNALVAEENSKLQNLVSVQSKSLSGVLMAAEMSINRSKRRNSHCHIEKEKP